MSLYGNISMLSSAMRSFQYGLDVTSNNLANAATPGYSRQVLNLEPLSPLFDQTLLLGQGVSSNSIQRVRDIFLDSRIKFELSELGRASVSKTALTELAAIFPEVATASATNGLKGAIDNVVAAWTNLSAAPNSAGAKTAVRDSLKAVADMLQLDARKVFDLQVKLDDQVKNTITEINTLADQISSLNTQIKLSSGKAGGQAPGALLDLREQAAEKLAKLIDANFTIIGDGTMVVSFNGGVLADGNQAKHLTTISSSYDPGRTAVGYFQSGLGQPTDVTAQIRGGKLGGLLAARDGEVERARLDLNRMAYGIISRSNEINHSYVAPDGTTGHDLFSGTSAADIIINPIVNANPDYVGGLRDTDGPPFLTTGDLALMQAQLKSFIQFSSMRTATFSTLGVTVDPSQPMSTQVFSTGPTATPGSPGTMIISTGGNAIPIVWDDSKSINEIIRSINSSGSGAFYATFDEGTQKFILVGQTPLTVYDLSGNLADVLMISSSVTSSAPVNNYPVPGAPSTLQVDPFGALNSTQNKLDIFTTPSVNGGTILIDGNPVNWTSTDQIQISLALAVQLATPTPGQVSLFWDSTTQTVVLEKSGDPVGANAGSHNFGAGNTMTGIQVVDTVGNLTRALNLDTNTNATKIMDELVVALGARRDAEGVLEQQAQALVDQTQQLQDNESKVDINQELAQARIFQRSYEASVRLQAIMDEMLNVLINHTGTSSSASGSV